MGGKKNSGREPKKVFADLVKVEVKFTGGTLSEIVECASEDCLSQRALIEAFFIEFGLYYDGDEHECTWDYLTCDQDDSIVDIDFYGYEDGTSDSSRRIPTQIGLLDSLEMIYLEFQMVKGTLPTEFGTMGNLEHMSLDNNILTGTIPSEMGFLGKLETIFLYENILTGTIPSEFGLLDLLELDIASNSLTGTIPTELGLLVKLDSLRLESNQLTGKIPTQIGLLTNLKEIDLSLNNLTGFIPTELGLLKNLEHIHILDGNNFAGGAPDEVCKLPNLNDEVLIALNCNSNDVSVKNGDDDDYDYGGDDDYDYGGDDDYD